VPGTVMTPGGLTRPIAKLLSSRAPRQYERRPRFQGRHRPDADLSRAAPARIAAHLTRDPANRGRTSPLAQGRGSLPADREPRDAVWMNMPWQDLSPAPEDMAFDDHLLARYAAELTGRRLLAMRQQDVPVADLRRRADALGHESLMTVLGKHRPDDAVLSEEGVDDSPRLSASRVWIVDPLDGTREYGEPPRDDWAVHVALWQDGELAAGAVALPALGATYDTATPPVVSAASTSHPRIAVSRTRPPAFIEGLAEHLGAELVPMGSAGAKVISIVRDVSDAYLHAGGQYEWDSAAPVAVARAAGLFTSRIDGADLEYNRPDPLLPDLIVCRPELADSIIGYVREHEG